MGGGTPGITISSSSLSLSSFLLWDVSFRKPSFFHLPHFFYIDLFIPFNLIFVKEFLRELRKSFSRSLDYTDFKE
jgi:hypothetical protein